MFGWQCLGWNESISWYAYAWIRHMETNIDLKRGVTRFSFSFLLLLLCASSQRNLFFSAFLFHTPFNLVFVSCACVWGRVCVRVTRVSVRHRKIYCFWPQPTVEMPYGLTQPIWQRSNCFIPEERKPCRRRRRCCYCRHKPILHFSMVWHFVCVCFFPTCFCTFCHSSWVAAVPKQKKRQATNNRKSFFFSGKQETKWHIHSHKTTKMRYFIFHSVRIVQQTE